MQDVELEQHLKAVSQDLNRLAAELRREFHGHDGIRRAAYALEQSSGKLNLPLLGRQLWREER